MTAGRSREWGIYHIHALWSGIHAMAKAKNVRLARAEPPSYLGPHHHVLRIDKDDHAKVVICNATVEGFECHWDIVKKRKTRCSGRKNGCPNCEKQMPGKWAGFFCCAMLPLMELRYLEVTAFAYEHLRLQIPHGENCRGLVCMVERERRNIKSPLRMSVLGRWEGPRTLPDPESVEPTLMKLWPAE